jgi:hypothetical protein
MISSCYRALVIAFFVVLLAIFWDQPAIWPIKVLVVMLHELAIASAAWLTGATVISLSVDAVSGGSTHFKGGDPMVIYNAGYVGSIGIGALLLTSSKHANHAPKAMIALATALLIFAGVVIEPKGTFTFQFAVASGVTLIGLGLLASQLIVAWTLRIIGTLSAIYPMWEIRASLFEQANINSGAQHLAKISDIPYWGWEAIWLLVGMLILLLFRRLLI